MGELDAEAPRERTREFEATVEASFAVLLPSFGDFDLAKRYLGKFETGLRAPETLCISRSPATATPRAFYTLDKG